MLHSQPLAVVSAADPKPGDLCTMQQCTNVLNMAITSMRSDELFDLCWVIPWAVRNELDSTPQICVQFIIFA